MDKVGLAKEVIEVLRKAPKERNELHTQMLAKALGGVSFFAQAAAEWGESALLDLLKYMYLEFVPRGQLLFEIGSKGEEFFIVLQGNMGIFYPVGLSAKTSPVVINPPPNSKADRWKSLFPGVIKSPPILNSEVVHSAEGTEVFFNGNPMALVGKKVEGESFGEAALAEGAPGKRNASILALTDTYLAVLDRATKMRVKQLKAEKRVQEELNFMRKLPWFSFLRESSLRALQSLAKSQSFNYRSYLFKRGEELNNIFIVKQGSVKIIEGKSSLLRGHGKLELGLLGQGEIIGQESVVKDRNTIAKYSVMINEATTIL
jgi:CRP-like cAMP-binding protein